MFIKVLSPRNLCSPETLVKWQSRMDSFYSEPQRHYHNLYHIDMLQSLTDSFVFPALTSPSHGATTLSMSEDQKSVFLLCVWFHDVVYDGRS